MTLPSIFVPPALLAAAVLISACSGAAAPQVFTGQTAAGGGLNAGQTQAVLAAAQEMTGDASAEVIELRGRAQPGEPGIHVCGYVNTPKQPGTPLYVELREKDGAPVAERGQIGATPANLAKVRFMCRNHGDW